MALILYAPITTLAKHLRRGAIMLQTGQMATGDKVGFNHSESCFILSRGPIKAFFTAQFMGFWKSLFSGSGASSVQTLAPVDIFIPPNIGSATQPQTQTLPQAQIFFSQDREVDLYELERLCDAVGWTRRPLRKVRKAIHNSFLVISMWQQRGNKLRLIGFARATSDSVFNATIWDVVVHPDVQGRGLGKALMRHIIKELRRADISNITLFADPHVVNFYEELGFAPDPEGIKGMFWYPSSR